jgi:hypothetical protein
METEEHKMGYVVYNKESTRLVRKANGDEFFKTLSAAKSHVTRYLDHDLYSIAEYEVYRANIEKTVERVNLMSGQKYMESINTPNYMSPASEAYWSM